MTALSTASLSTSTSPTREPAGPEISNKIVNGGGLELDSTPVIKGLGYVAPPAIIASNYSADAGSGHIMPLPPPLELPTPHYESNSIANDDDDAFMQFSGTQVFSTKLINLAGPRAPETFLWNVFSIILRLSARRGGINSTSTNFEGLECSCCT